MEKETKTDKNGYAVNEEFGTVKIANDVVAMIAGLAATEVEGVGAMADEGQKCSCRSEKGGWHGVSYRLF